jgi:hypothetical protein
VPSWFFRSGSGSLSVGHAGSRVSIALPSGTRPPSPRRHGSQVAAARVLTPAAALGLSPSSSASDRAGLADQSQADPTAVA